MIATNLQILYLTHEHWNILKIKNMQQNSFYSWNYSIVKLYFTNTLKIFIHTLVKKSSLIWKYILNINPKKYCMASPTFTATALTMKMQISKRPIFCSFNTQEFMHIAGVPCVIRSHDSTKRKCLTSIIYIYNS